MRQAHVTGPKQATPATRTLHIAQNLFIAAALLIVGPASKSVLAAPTVSISAEDLGTIYGAANESLRSMKSRCLKSADQDGLIDLKARVSYSRSAQNLAWIVRDYPYEANTNGAWERDDHTMLAVQAYERAFNCNPSWSNRHYLSDALDLITFRLDLATEHEKRSRDAEDLQPLTEAETRLRLRLQKLHAPPCTAKAVQCPLPESVQESQAPDVRPRARLRRALDNFALGIEVGTGASSTKVNSQVYVESLFAFAISPSYRLLLGTHSQHRVHLGFLYGLQAGKFGEPPNDTYTTSVVTAQLDYALADETGWLAVHASLGAGFQQTNRSQVQSTINPGFGICVLREIVCLRGRSFLRLRHRDSVSTIRDFWTIAIGIDPIRLFARLPKKKKEKKKKKKKSDPQ